MRLTGAFVLPVDAVLQPVDELSEQFRRNSGSEEGDFAISRKKSRAHSKIVDARAAALLRQFEQPSTIAVAVARFTRSENGDPDRILEDALPLLRSLIDEGLLVSADSAEAGTNTESLAAGDRVGEWVAVRCIQSLEDTELYQVRDGSGRWGALKVCRAGNARGARSVANEIHILGTVASPSVPRLLAAEGAAERPYLVTEWFRGISVQAAAAELRRESGLGSRRELLRLGDAILAAYAALHGQGVLHGDVHARNLLVDGAGQVMVLDFGAARLAAESPGSGRAGVSFLFEPEFALAALKDAPPPPTTFAGEQYALAALLYLLATGSYTHDFLLERSQMFRQIAVEETLLFSARGLKPWPGLEQALARALSKNPAERYRSVKEFAEAWRAVEIPLGTLAAPAVADSALREIRLEVERKAAIGGEWMRNSFRTAPSVSVNHGSAGLAYALYRMACCADDGELLAAADAWSQRSVREMMTEAAFFNREIGATSETIGRASLYHQPPGVYLTQAVLAAARSDHSVLQRATEQFIAYGADARAQPDANIDLTLGLAGSLLGSAFLLDALHGSELSPDSRQTKDIEAFGQELFAQLWSMLDGHAPVGESPGLEDTGMAHGWAGLLYASLCWCAAAEQAVPPSLRQRLEQLAKRAEPAGRGLQWLWGGSRSMPGWCNGSAGFVFLWTEAHKALGESQYLALAEGAAWSAWETPGGLPSLCCGLPGQAYALLNLYRSTGEESWLKRARQLGDWAGRASVSAWSEAGTAASTLHRESLYYGISGAAVLAADLDRPFEARMPFFERE